MSEQELTVLTARAKYSNIEPESGRNCVWYFIFYPISSCIAFIFTLSKLTSESSLYKPA